MIGRVSVAFVIVIALLGGVAVFGLSNFPRQQAEADQIRSVTQRDDTLFELELPLRETQVQAAVKVAEAQTARNVAQIEREQWLDGERVKIRAAGEAAQSQYEIDVRYAVAGVLIAVGGTAALGLTIFGLVWLYRHWLADPWKNLAYRRQMRELGQLRDQFIRTQAAAVSKVTEPAVPRNGEKPQPEPETLPQI